MAQVELVMPKMGESIMEATILNWVKKEGDSVEVDETILEIATDKVDSEVPSPVEGVISKIFYEEDETVEIGEVIALISTEGEAPAASPSVSEEESEEATEEEEEREEVVEEKEPATTPTPEPAAETKASSPQRISSKSGEKRFYSPLVRNIASRENISQEELDAIEGSGLRGRVTKKDILAYVEDKKAGKVPSAPRKEPAPESKPKEKAPERVVKAAKETTPPSENTEIIEMDRMRKLIAEHMVHSKHTSPHVTSFVEADVTNLVQWRNRIKKDFQEKYGEKITYTPLFIEAIVKAIRDFPMINISVDGDKITRYKDINIGMAAALPSGNLIVPVIQNADELNLIGLTKSVNDLATRARANKLKPEEIQGGTFTLTNVGTFGNVMGTPIINQPQVAIMAAGAIRKKPAVIETPSGDFIGIRHLMFLSMSYDHRVVDGFLGGSFLRKVADYLEEFDPNREI